MLWDSSNSFSKAAETPKIQKALRKKNTHLPTHPPPLWRKSSIPEHKWTRGHPSARNHRFKQVPLRKYEFRDSRSSAREKENLSLNFVQTRSSLRSKESSCYFSVLQSDSASPFLEQSSNKTPPVSNNPVLLILMSNNPSYGGTGEGELSAFRNKRRNLEMDEGIGKGNDNRKGRRRIF